MRWARGWRHSLSPRVRNQTSRARSALSARARPSSCNLNTEAAPKSDSCSTTYELFTANFLSDRTQPKEFRRRRYRACIRGGKALRALRSNHSASCSSGTQGPRYRMWMTVPMPVNRGLRVWFRLCTLSSLGHSAALGSISSHAASDGGYDWVQRLLGLSWIL